MDAKIGDIVIYNTFFGRKQGKIKAFSKDGKTCIINNKLIKISDIYKVLQK